MGAESFFDYAQGNSPEEAFAAVVKEARYLYGHGGYTGTIAEKEEFILLPFEGDHEQVANALVDQDDSPVSDKWGPAGCFDLGNGKYYFFGRASS